MGKSIYAERNEQTDITDPQSVLDTIKGYVESDLSNEQKLYGIGLLLNQNKEHYINALKGEKSKLVHERDQLKSEIAKMKKQPEQKAEPKTDAKKKVVIVKKAAK